MVDNEENDGEMLKDEEFPDDENDPEILAIKKAMEEEKEKFHKRETTQDIAARLEKEIAEIAQESNEEEKKVEIEDINNILGEQNTNETEVNIDTIENVPLEESPVKSNPEIDNIWSLYVENAKIDKEKQEEQSIEKILQNPFLQKMLSPEAPEVLPAVPMEFSDMIYGKLLLFPILIGNYKILRNVVSDYIIRKDLKIHELIANDKYFYKKCNLKKKE